MKYIKDYVNNWIEEIPEEERESAINDALNYGCINGCVNGLIYYKDTLEFFDKYKYEINDLVGAFDMPTCDLFGDSWDLNDQLVLETNNRNLMAWFAFETTLGQLTD
jgi:hypothetical protein